MSTCRVFSRWGHITTLCLYDLALSPPCGERIMYPVPPPFMSMVCVFESPLPRVGVVGGGWRMVSGGDGWFLLRALGVGRRGMVGGVLGGDG